MIVIAAPMSSWKSIAFPITFVRVGFDFVINVGPPNVISCNAFIRLTPAWVLSKIVFAERYDYFSTDKKTTAFY